MAMRIPSDVAMSALAGDTATTTTLGGVTNFLTMDSMSRTMDAGWSAVGTLVRPEYK